MLEPWAVRAGPGAPSRPGTMRGRAGGRHRLAVLQRLNQALAGQVLTRTEFRVRRWPRHWPGSRVREVVSRGKHQLFRFGNEQTLHTHFRMEGTWRPFHGGPLERRPRSRSGPCCGRPRTTPSGTDCPSWASPHRRGAQGWSVTWAGPARPTGTWTRLAPDRGPTARTVGEALLDQRNLAGIGTLYRAELLFLQGIHPRMPVQPGHQPASAHPARPAAAPCQPLATRAVHHGRPSSGPG